MKGTTDLEPRRHRGTEMGKCCFSLCRCGAVAECRLLRASAFLPSSTFHPPSSLVAVTPRCASVVKKRKRGRQCWRTRRGWIRRAMGDLWKISPRGQNTKAKVRLCGRPLPTRRGGLRNLGTVGMVDGVTRDPPSNASISAWLPPSPGYGREKSARRLEATSRLSRRVCEARKLKL